MKKIQNQFAAFLLLAAVLTVSLVSCQRSNGNADASRISVLMTDAPGPFSAVNLDVLTVEVKVDTATAHRHDDRHGDDDADGDDKGRQKDDFGYWVSLSTTAKVYNLLDLRNGIDAELAAGNIQGTIRKVRITLGDNNTIVKNDSTFALNFLNPEHKYLYVKVRNEHHHDSASTAKLWIDFDVARSIAFIGGKYYLRPVLRPFCDKNFAGVEGVVTPAAAGAVVKAISGTDTATAIPNADGRFKIRGLANGTYAVLYAGSNGYKDTTINNVVLTRGRSVRLPNVVLHQ